MKKHYFLLITVFVFGITTNISQGTEVVSPSNVPEIEKWPEQDPGESKKIQRIFPCAVPLIPHSIEGLTITLKANDCADCHVKNKDTDPGTPTLPKSHFISRSGNQLKTFDKRRYFCTLCHVPQNNAKPLVDNLY